MVRSRRDPPVRRAPIGPLSGPSHARKMLVYGFKAVASDAYLWEPGALDALPLEGARRAVHEYVVKNKHRGAWVKQVAAPPFDGKGEHWRLGAVGTSFAPA
jgi:hypothetical protein